MATFAIPAAPILANIQLNSPGVQPGVNFNRVVVQLTDPLSLWPATPDATRHIVVWGFQNSPDGVNWNWGPTHQREPLPGLPFGSRDKNGGLPGLSLESSALVGDPNTRLRLAILTDANITLGASITVT